MGWCDESNEISKMEGDGLPTYLANYNESEWQRQWVVWPDWAIYYTLGNFLKPLATANLPKSPLLGNFSKGVKIYHFSSEIIFGQLL